MRRTAALFDFDGTLADTLPICFHALRRTFREFNGEALTDARIAERFGPTEPDILRRHLRRPERAEEAIAFFYRCYEEEHDAFVRPDPRIDAMLDALRERGVRTGVVTGKAGRSLAISLERLGWTGRFGTLVSGDDVRVPKPDPEGVLLAMRRLGAAPAETLFVGDSDADVGAGRRAGVFAAGAHWLPVVQTRAFAVRPDAVYTDPAQLLRAL